MNSRFRFLFAVSLALSATQALAAQHDFDGDGRDDVVWRNSSSGANALWRSGDSATAGALASVPNGRWIIAGVGDFDGDGRADLLWRQRSTGANSLWPSGNLATARALPVVADTAWYVAGVGDFDGNGRSDVLWRNRRSGGNVLWNGADPATSHSIGPVPVELTIAGIGDLDGDRRDDVVWRNLRTGAVAVWPAAIAARVRQLTTVANLRWQIQAIGDFDGDGRADLFWREAWEGRNVIWSSGNSTTGRVLARIADNGWQVVAVGDFNGDGRADLFWRHHARSFHAIWPSANAAAGSGARATAPLAWTVVPFEGQPTLPTMEVADAAFVEGNSGTRTARIRVRLSHPSVEPVHAALYLTDFWGEATAPMFAEIDSDFTTAFGSQARFDIAPGETTFDVPVAILGDVAPETNERFWALADVAGGALLANNYPDIRILNDDANTLWIESTSTVVYEGDAGTRSMVFMVYLSRPASTQVRCAVATTVTHSTAVAGVDYRATSGNVVFAPGTTSAAFLVPIMGDTVAEEMETVWATISNGSGAQIVGDTAINYIYDDDAP